MSPPTTATAATATNPLDALYNHYVAELTASHKYRAMAHYFSLASVNYPGCAAYFAKEAESEATHAAEFAALLIELGYNVRVRT